MSGGLNAAIFRQALKNILQQAQAQGQPFVDVLAGDLHRQVGGVILVRIIECLYVAV